MNADSEWIVALTQEHSPALSSTSLVLCHAAEALIELKSEELALGVLAEAAVSVSPFARGTHETTRQQLCRLVQALHVPDAEVAKLLAAFRP